MAWSLMHSISSTQRPLSAPAPSCHLVLSDEQGPGCGRVPSIHSTIVRTMPQFTEARSCVRMALQCLLPPLIELCSDRDLKGQCWRDRPH